MTVKRGVRAHNPDHRVACQGCGKRSYETFKVTVQRRFLGRDANPGMGGHPRAEFEFCIQCMEKGVVVTRTKARAIGMETTVPTTGAAVIGSFRAKKGQKDAIAISKGLAPKTRN